MAPLTLRERWLAVMRASTDRAVGRECDFAMSEGDADVFDPLGLLALIVIGPAGGYRTAAQPVAWHNASGEDGAFIPRRDAAWLAITAGFPPARLYDLALLNDAGVSWADMADYVEAQK